MPNWEVRVIADNPRDVECVASVLGSGQNIVAWTHESRRLRFLRASCQYRFYSDIGEALVAPSEAEYIGFFPRGFVPSDKFIKEASRCFTRERAGIVTFPVLIEGEGKEVFFEELVLGCFAWRRENLGVGAQVYEMKYAGARCQASGLSPIMQMVSLKKSGVRVSGLLSPQNIPMRPEQGDLVFEDKSDHKPHGIQGVNEEIKIIDSASALDLVLFSPPESRGSWRFVEERDIPQTQKDFEQQAREVRGNWMAIHWGSGSWNWSTVCRTAFAHMDKAVLAFPGLTLVHPGKFRRLQPLMPDMKTWTDEVRDYAHCVTFDAEGAQIAVSNVPNDPIMSQFSGDQDPIYGTPIEKKSGRGLKVAVLSMCGVTSFEDQYGLGGEHQVVHWLREGFLHHPDVALCDIYDTQNIGLAPDNYYDLVLSNSCWHTPPKVTKGGISIFWHFNTNAYRGNELTVMAFGYTHVWTNSPISLAEFRRHGISCRIKHLNASSFHHGIYPWESELFRHDACYVGGYQVEYKGKGLIDQYIKPCMGVPIDFVIYGNRKWRYDVQEEALKTDRSFKKEHLDPSFEPHYRGVLHPDDFWILAKNCKVWVNFNAEDQRPLEMVNDRPIWAMGCGAFVITDDYHAQREVYGATCDYSHGGPDLARRVERWVRNEDERLERGEQAYENMKRHRLFTNDTVDQAVETHLKGRA